MANKVEFLLNEDPSQHGEVLQHIAYAYMTVFGNTPGVNEGGIHKDGLTMPLDRYMDCLIMSARDRGHLKNVFPSVAHPTKDLIQLIEWLNNLPENERAQTIATTRQNTGGYEPYYNLTDVVGRFKRDLTPQQDIRSIVAYWGDGEYPLAGFLTGLVADNQEAFLRLVGNIPYLAAVDNIGDQVISFIDQAQGISFPLLFEHEGVVIPERRSRQKGSKWDELVLTVRTKAQEMDARHIVGFTFEESGYYQKGTKNNDFIYDFPIGAPGMHFFVTDLDTSIAKLQAKNQHEKFN